MFYLEKKNRGLDYGFDFLLGFFFFLQNMFCVLVEYLKIWVKQALFNTEVNYKKCSRGIWIWDTFRYDLAVIMMVLGW